MHSGNIEAAKRVQDYSHILSLQNIRHYIEWQLDEKNNLVSVDITVDCIPEGKIIVYHFKKQQNKFDNINIKPDIMDMDYDMSLIATLHCQELSQDFQITIVPGSNKKDITWYLENEEGGENKPA